MAADTAALNGTYFSDNILLNKVMCRPGTACGLLNFGAQRARPRAAAALAYQCQPALNVRPSTWLSLWFE
jgi:hypothetical protein